VLRICQHNVEVGLKHVPDRLPIDTRRFHCNVLNA
jgi:hypothetical protein